MAPGKCFGMNPVRQNETGIGELIGVFWLLLKKRLFDVCYAEFRVKNYRRQNG
jgi:hypothetical protein